MPRKTFELAPAGVRPGRFNEAAARCRGKRRRRALRCQPASRFNEAAARCRGKPADAWASDGAAGVLQ